MHGALSTKFSTISIVTQGNSADALFDGLLTKLPTILDSFFSPVPQVITWGWLVRGGGEPRSSRENTRCVVTLVLWIHWAWNGPKSS